MNRLKSQSPLYLLEINDKFWKELKKKYHSHEKDNQIEIRNRDAVDLSRISNRNNISIDTIISGLPMTFFPDQLSGQILRSIYEELEPGGIYVQFTYWPMIFINNYKYNMKDFFKTVPDKLFYWIIYQRLCIRLESKIKFLDGWCFYRKDSILKSQLLFHWESTL